MVQRPAYVGGRRSKRNGRTSLIFDRAAAGLRAIEVTELTLDHPSLVDAADIFGLRVV